MNTSILHAGAAHCGFVALAGSLVLSACGGGDASDGQAAVVTSSDDRRLPLAVAKAPDATSFLDWAERAYPQYFPSHQANLSLSPYVYRYYPETGNYIGVPGSTVSVLGPVSGNGVANVGSLSDFACQVTPADCGLAKVTTQPKSAYALPGETASISIRADNTTMLQWQLSTDGGFSFADMKGVVGGTLSLTSVKTTDNGKRYRVVVSNAKGQVISDVAVLTVLSSVPTTGSASECVMAAMLPPGRVVQLISQSTGGNLARSSVTTVAKPGVLFDGQLTTAYEARMVSGIAGVSPATGTIYSTYDAASGVVSSYGSSLVSDYGGGSGSETRTTLSPPQADNLAALRPGESQPEQLLSGIKTSISTTRGVASTPVVKNFSGSFIKTFVGMEAVTTRAGTFRTCKVLNTSVTDGKTSTNTSWLLAGSGVNFDLWQNRTEPVLSVLVDGVPITRN